MEKENLLEWIEKIDRFADRIGNDPEPLRGVDEVSWPSIQRVPAYMGARVELKNFYVPMFISFGPIHMGNPCVEQGRHYKLRWTAMYLQQTNQTLDDLIHRLSENRQYIEKFTGEYWNSIYRHARGIEFPFEKALVVDGCSVLQLLDDSVGSEYPEEELKFNIDQLVRVHQDMLLLENQIPYTVLKLICGDDKDRLKRCMRNFLQIHGIDSVIDEQEDEDVVGGASPEHRVIVEQEDEDPIHLLDYLRRALLARDRDHIHKVIITKRQTSLHHRKYRVGTIRELKAQGIRILKRKDTSFSPDFNYGLTEPELVLPEFTVNGSTALIFYNLIAYEMCPDFRNDYEITSYIVFLSSLIEKPEDVNELWHAGILYNDLANDKQVADLFNQMDFLLVPETAKFARITNDIQYQFIFNDFRLSFLRRISFRKAFFVDEAYNNYFRSPWTIMALLAAALGLVLTFIQTWYAIHPKKG